MRKLSFKPSLQIVLAVSALAWGTALAEAGKVRSDIARGKLIFTEGKGDAAACASCHGEKGLGMDAMGSPRLANIGYGYIIKQLSDFATDQRIPAPDSVGAMMNDVARALSEQDRRDVAVYLSSLEYATEPSDLAELAAAGHKIGQAELGKIIVVNGVKGNIPACQACHAFNGRNPRFPAINQQKYVYLVNQLKSWRDGSRTNDPKVDNQGIMQSIAKKFSDDDIVNIAAFLTSAPRISPEEEQAPAKSQKQK